MNVKQKTLQRKIQHSYKLKHPTKLVIHTHAELLNLFAVNNKRVWIERCICSINCRINFAFHSLSFGKGKQFICFLSIQVILCLRSNHGYLRLNNVCHRFSKNCHIVNLVIVPPAEGATRIGRSFFIRNFAFVKRYGKTGKSGPSAFYLCSEKGFKRN